MGSTLVSNVAKCCNYDANMARLEEKMDDVLAALLTRITALEESVKSTNDRVDDIIRKPLQFAGWAIAAVLLAVFSAVGVKIFQVAGHLFDSVKKVW